MSDAPVTEADLQAQVDGRLSPERGALVAVWLAERPAEAERLAAYATQREALRAALDPVVDEPLPPALDLRLRERPRPRRFAAAQSAALVASTVALLLFGGVGGWILRGHDVPPTTGTAALAREAVASYAVYAHDRARPVELAARDRQTLDHWFSERLSRRIKAPDLTGAGLRLIGGRLIATEHGPAGLYLYGSGNGTRVALYVRPMAAEGTDRMTRREQRGVGGWTWADGGLGFGVFGAGSPSFLHGAADIVRAQYRRA